MTCDNYNLIFFDVEATPSIELVGWSDSYTEFKYGSVGEFIDYVNSVHKSSILIGKNSSVFRARSPGHVGIPYDLPFLYYRTTMPTMPTTELSDYIIKFDGKSGNLYEWMKVTTLFKDGTLFSDVQDIEQMLKGSLKYMAYLYLHQEYTESLSDDFETLIQYNREDIRYTKDLFYYKDFGVKHLNMLLGMIDQFDLDTPWLNGQRIVNKYVAGTLEVNPDYNLSIHIARMNKFKSTQASKALADLLLAKVTDKIPLPQGVKVGNLTIVPGFGGLHGGLKNVTVLSSDTLYIYNMDFASAYPRIYTQLGMFSPVQEGKLLQMTKDRITYKKSNPIKALGMKKLLNSLFGKLNNVDELHGLGIGYVTSIGQLALMDLINEELKSPIQLIDINTDGFLFASSTPLYTDGDTFTRVFGGIEFSVEVDAIDKVYYKDVSNYMIVAKSGKLKKKGVFTGTTRVSGTVTTNVTKDTSHSIKDRVVKSTDTKSTVKYGIPNIVHYASLLDAGVLEKVNAELLPHYFNVIYQAWGETEHPYGEHMYTRLNALVMSQVDMEFDSATPWDKTKYDSFGDFVVKYGDGFIPTEEWVIWVGKKLHYDLTKSFSIITSVDDFPPSQQCPIIQMLSTEEQVIIPFEARKILKDRVKQVRPSPTVFEWITTYNTPYAIVSEVELVNCVTNPTESFMFSDHEKGKNAVVFANNVHSPIEVRELVPISKKINKIGGIQGKWLQI